MDETAQKALGRLRDPARLRALARLVVDEAAATPLREVAEPRWLASQLATALEAFSRGDHAREWAARRIAEGRERWSEAEGTLRDHVPAEAEEPLRKLLQNSWSPDEDLAFRVLDQPAMHALVREVLEETLNRFARRLRSLDSGLGGLGQRAARRGRGLLGNLSQNLGGLKDGLVGVVADEVEQVVQSRIKGFVGGASQEAVRSIARHVADPQRASAFGELRVGVMEVLLDSPVAELAAEIDKSQPEELVEVLVRAIRATVQDPAFVDRSEARIAELLESAGDGTLGAWLQEVGLAEVWAETTTELVAARLQAVVGTEGFESWWAELFA